MIHLKDDLASKYPSKVARVTPAQMALVCKSLFMFPFMSLGRTLGREGDDSYRERNVVRKCIRNLLPSDK